MENGEKPPIFELGLHLPPRESRELLHFFGVPKMGRAAGLPTARTNPVLDGFLAERRNPLGKARKFPSGRVLVDNSASDAARHFRLDRFQGLGGFLLLARLDGRLDGLDEGPDAADARVVDGRPRRVAADALFGLRRIRRRVPLAQ